MVDRGAEGPSIWRTLTALHRYRHLLRNLVLKDLKLKYRGSVIGFLWSLANPLLMVAVYTIAFTSILGVAIREFRVLPDARPARVDVLRESVSMSTGSIVDNGGLVKSVLFPRAILPMATVLFNLAQYLLSVLVFLPIMLLWYRVPPACADAAVPGVRRAAGRSSRSASR